MGCILREDERQTNPVRDQALSQNRTTAQSTCLLIQRPHRPLLEERCRPCWTTDLPEQGTSPCWDFSPLSCTLSQNIPLLVHSLPLLGHFSLTYELTPERCHAGSWRCQGASRQARGAKQPAENAPPPTSTSHSRSPGAQFRGMRLTACGETQTHSLEPGSCPGPLPEVATANPACL